MTGDKGMSTVNSISLMQQIQSMASQAKGQTVEPTEGANGFADMFQQAISQVNDLSHSAETQKTKFELGDPSVQLSDVVIAGQKADLAFQATLQVRNKLVQAYQDIMNMSV